MPKKLNPTTDKRIYSKLAELTRHLRSCKRCQGAKKSLDPLRACEQGLLMAMFAASDLEDIIRLRIAAHTKHPNAIFACPDLAAHGASYAITATPYSVIAIQDALF